MLHECRLHNPSLFANVKHTILWKQITCPVRPSADFRMEQMHLIASNSCASIVSWRANAFCQNCERESEGVASLGRQTVNFRTECFLTERKWRLPEKNRVRSIFFTSSGTGFELEFANFDLWFYELQTSFEMIIELESRFWIRFWWKITATGRTARPLSRI